MKRLTSILALMCGLLLAACGTATTQPSATVASVNQASTADIPVAAATTIEPDDDETAVPQIDLGPPTKVVETFLTRVRDRQYAEAETLMTDLLRDAFVQGAGSVGAGFQASDSRDGKLVSYRLGTARAVSEQSVTVDVELESERVTTQNTIEVVNEDGTWKVANIIAR